MIRLVLETPSIFGCIEGSNGTRGHRNIRSRVSHIAQRSRKTRESRRSGRRRCVRRTAALVVLLAGRSRLAIEQLALGAGWTGSHLANGLASRAHVRSVWWWWWRVDNLRLSWGGVGVPGMRWSRRIHGLWLLLVERLVRSGSGRSVSWRNFSPGEVSVGRRAARSTPFHPWPVVSQRIDRSRTHRYAHSTCFNSRPI